MSYVAGILPLDSINCVSQALLFIKGGIEFGEVILALYSEVTPYPPILSSVIKLPPGTSFKVSQHWNTGILSWINIV